MSISTDWLIASEAEAEAVASILTTEERSFDDWPSTCLEGIGELELTDLAAVLRGDGQPARSTVGELLYEASEDGPFVAAVERTFIEALAGLSEQSYRAIANAWRASEHLTGWPSDDVMAILARMSHFARQAKEKGMPVLQLMTL
jgi:hypothetical protein